MNVHCIKTDLNRGIYWAQSVLETRRGFEENDSICLYPQIREQRFLGFGGAVTEAAAYNWLRLPPDAARELIEAYYGDAGLRYTLGRTHINSCDFSLGNYACVSDPMDTTLSTFQMERDRRYLLPMLSAASDASRGELRLMLSPWSPPAFMKTNGEMNHGGKLKAEYRSLWARCMARFVREYRDAGIDVQYISVQNEPNAVQTWDSCVYSAEEEAEFAAQYLYPALREQSAEDVKILIWDHNKDQLLDRMTASLADAEQAKRISGAAFHWYSGDHFEAVALARRLYPDKLLLFSEGCVEYARCDGMSDLDKAERYAHDIIGNLNAGANGSIDWNLLLDAQGGPNHVGNYCEAPIMCTSEGTLEKKGSYYYIGQLSRFIRRDAVRIGLSRFTGDLEATAFSNPDGTIAVAILNPSGTDRRVNLRLSRTEYLPVLLDAHTVVTCVTARDSIEGLPA